MGNKNKNKLQKMPEAKEGKKKEDIDRKRKT